MTAAALLLALGLMYEPVVVRGVVVDEAGRPVADASDDEYGPQFLKTGADGRFRVSTNAPLFIVRKRGFRSAVVRVADVRDEVRVVLQLLPDDGRFPVCTGAAARPGVSIPALRLSGNAGVRKTVPFGGDDTSGESIFVKGSKSTITRIGGPMWGPGKMKDTEVWNATNVEDATYWAGRRNDGFPVHVSRWTDADGRVNRIIGHFGEQISYRKVSPDEARLLDPVMDRVCMGTPASMK